MENIIVGAGLSGAVLANLIADKLGEKVVVIDRRCVVGGNIYDYKDKETGITVQKYGPHIFHTNNKKVWDYLSKFTKWNYFFFKPNAIMEGNCVSIPFNLTTLYELFSESMAQRIEEKLINRFGYGVKVPILKLRDEDDEDLKFIAQYVYKHMFENYTSKQWGLKPEEIDPSVTARVPIFISHDCRYFQDKYQGIPINGYTKMIENMLNHPNIEVKLNTDSKEYVIFSHNENGVDSLKKSSFCKRIFYSGAIDEFFDYKYGQLPYRSLDFDIQTIDKEYFQKSAMTNYPNNYDFTRITEHKYFLNEKSDKSVISIEYPQPFVLGENERYYPISNSDTQNLYERYNDEAAKIDGLYFIGRLGEYKYYNMDLAVERIFELFEKIGGLNA